MAEGNLLQDGGFSSGYTYWELDGLTDNAQLSDEGGNTFARFGPDVQAYQNVIVEAYRAFTIRFRMRAGYAGNGLTVRVSAVDAEGNPTRSLFSANFGETDGWVETEAHYPGSVYTAVRVAFEVTSGADLDDASFVGGDFSHLPGLVGKYYQGDQLGSFQFEKIDPNLDFQWPTDKPPTNGDITLPGSNYSVSWSGVFLPPKEQRNLIVFILTVNDGVKFWATPKSGEPEVLLLDAWGYNNNPSVHTTGPIMFNTGLCPLRLEYRNGPGNAGRVELQYYLSDDGPDTAAIVPPDRFYHVATDDAHMSAGHGKSAEYA